MATWTKAKREATPLKNFGDPANREYPIEDQDDVDSAADLIGKAKDPDAVKKRIIAIAKRLKLSIPDAWQAKKADMGAEEFTANDISGALYDALGDAYPPNPLAYEYLYVVDFIPGKNLVIFSKAGDKYQQEYSLDDSCTATLIGTPVDVTQRTVYVAESEASMGEFDIAEFAEPIGDYVPWKSKIFECGIFPKQGVNASSPSYLDKMVANFKAGRLPQFNPGRLKNTHTPDPQSIFSKVDLGRCEKVWREGTDLWGAGMMHRAVKALIGTPKASIEIHDKVDNPTLGEIALLNFPQVRDARVAAFAAFFAGARHSKADLEHIQSVHDHCAQLGAVCDSSPAEMGKRHSNTDQAAIQQMHDLACEQGATCPAADSETRATPMAQTTETPGAAAMGAPDHANARAASAKETTMSKPTAWERFKAVFGKNPEALEKEGITQAAFEAVLGDAEPKQQATASPELAEQMAAFEADRAVFRSRILNEEAAKFTNDIIYRQRKARKGQEAMVEAMYKTAAMADGGGVATFSATGELKTGEAVKTLMAYFDSLPADKAMMGDQIADAAPGKTQDRDARTKARVARSVEAYN